MKTSGGQRQAFVEQSCSRGIDGRFAEVMRMSMPCSRDAYRYVQHVAKSGFLRHLAGKLRRFYLLRFRMGYVKKQLTSRKGECHQCGRCCAFVFTCPMLTRQRLCRIYRKYRPQVCRLFPLDQRDIAEVAIFGNICGYRFEKDLHSLTPPPIHCE